MNPFDLRGPEFLLFYALIAVVACLGLVYLRHAREGSGVYPKPKLDDPYLIAYLRGGKNAAISTALVSLVDRKIVEVPGDAIKVAKGQPKTPLTDPLERALVNAVAIACKPSALKSLNFPAEFQIYENMLSGLGLLPNAGQRSERVRDTAAACLALAAVAGIKIVIALSRGRTNTLGLIVLGVIAIIAAIAAGNPRLTARGKDVVADMKNLFHGLEGRAVNLRPGTSPVELALVAALFGVAAVPVSAFPLREKLFPKPAGAGGGCGSSCGSSDGGSSCGGGGCGGGCGGCGS